MVQALSQCKEFSNLLTSGIPCNGSFSEKNWILYEWYFSLGVMPDNVKFYLKRNKAKVLTGFILVNKSPALLISFDRNGYYFTKLMSEEHKNEKWESVWLYDLRVQLAVGLLIKIIEYRLL